jgi:zinc protease
MGLLYGLLLVAPVWAGPQIQSWIAPTGARVYLVENHTLPMLDVGVLVDAGTRRVPPDLAGLAELTVGMLKAGTGRWDEAQITQQLTGVGALMSAGANEDSAGVSLRTLSSLPQREVALQVLEAILSQPQFPATVLQRELERSLAALRQAEAMPAALAEKTLTAMLYRDHPYGMAARLSPESLQRITREQLLAFYRRHYSAPNAVVTLVGAVTRAEAEAIAERLTRNLPAASLSPAPLQPVVPVAAAERRLPHHVSQAHILLGLPVLRRHDPDYYALLVGNHILGNGFGSRLVAEVREKRGLAYSVYSTFSPMAVEGEFQIGLQTRREQTDAALAVVRATLADFIANGPTADELERAQSALINGFVLRHDSNREIAEWLGVIGFYQLPLTFLDDYPQQVARLTVADIQRAFATRVRPEQLQTVIVGATGAASQEQP